LTLKTRLLWKQLKNFIVVQTSTEDILMINDYHWLLDLFSIDFHCHSLLCPVYISAAIQSRLGNKDGGHWSFGHLRPWRSGCQQGNLLVPHGLKSGGTDDQQGRHGVPHILDRHSGHTYLYTGYTYTILLCMRIL
jgi:hypothetical protein